MEKRVWTKPLAEVEQFMANEYIAACGDQNTVYKFVCDAGYIDKEHEFGFCGCGSIHGWPAPSGTYKTEGHWTVYDSNGKRLTSGYYHPCGATHEAPTSDAFINGTMYNQNTNAVEAVPVIVWTEGGTDVHCTTNLDMTSWETAKS